MNTGTSSSYTWGEGLFGIILFLIVAGVFMGGNGMFGGNKNSDAASTEFVAGQISNQNDKFVANQLATQNFALQSAIADAKYDNLSGVKDLQGQIALGNQTMLSQMAQCCLTS